jgi:Ulp1 family protease
MEGAYSYEVVRRWTNNVDIFELDKIVLSISGSGVH